MPVPIPNLNQLQISQPQPATMKMQGMAMQNELSRIGIAKDRNAIAREGQALEREGFEFNKMKQNLMLGKEYLPTLQKDEYGKYRKWVESIGAPAQFLPSEEDVSKMSNEEFSDLKLRMIMGSDNIGKMQLEQYKSTLREADEAIKQKNRIELKKTIPGKAPSGAGEKTDQFALEALRQKNRIALKTTESNREFAPQPETWRNTETGKTLTVDEANDAEMQQATQQGFKPIGPREKGYLTKEGSLGAEYAGQIAAGGAKARASVVTLETMDKLLDRFRSGKMAGIEKSAQQWFNALGIPIDTTNLSAKETFLAIGEQLALQSRNMGEGMVLAGQMSDRDVQFLRDMNPQLLISKGGNKLLIKIRKAIAKRNVEISSLAKEYRDQNEGVLDQIGFDDYVKEKLSPTSIFGVPEGAPVVGTDKVTGLPIYESDGKLFVPNF